MKETRRVPIGEHGYKPKLYSRASLIGKRAASLPQSFYIFRPHHHNCFLFLLSSKGSISSRPRQLLSTSNPYRSFQSWNPDTRWKKRLIEIGHFPVKSERIPSITVLKHVLNWPYFLCKWRMPVLSNL